MITDAERAAWDRDGYFFLRGGVDPELAAAVEAEVVDRIRADPPERHPGEATYLSGENYLIYPETEPSPGAKNPEDLISKVFNCHAEGLSRELAGLPQISRRVAGLLGPDIDCFQSQFIFKNPGVIGQPWHQDSYYFKFDKQPQVGVWVALSRATLENGCLWVVPGTHGPERIFEHIPDRRPAANRGYLEIVSEDTRAKTSALMEPGDVLFFHSYLMHMSTDNVADYRRSAMVYHYGRAGTRALTPEGAAVLARVNRWIPILRAA
ncbi:phytanoyl-CoA dioxygenase family protein [Phenylobacterium sp.]|uniref:phytanoyl-CoA dioxygenase family protein n=1 Tax=Phenylobacterium sp. TaxID=1871053 RepID=UPI0025D4AEA5|nr:phytanoyl-CoA dioxygenase family protein [Phenylobacterium sp.]MBX3484330.1 phytanoyl-CoA dioxygenase family protein [Phenylobacterium sp.]